VVQAVLDEVEFLFGDAVQPLRFGQVLPNEAVGVLVESSLPGGIGTGEVDVSRQRLSHALVFGELPSIVISDGMDAVPVRGERPFNGLAHRPGLFGFRRGEDRVARSPFDQGQDGAPMAFTDEGVALPVADPGFALDDDGTLFDADPARDAAPAVLGAIALLPFLPAAQMRVQIAALEFVLIDTQVNPFVADRDALLLKQAARDLLRAPVPAEEGLDQTPGGRADPGPGLGGPAGQGLLMGLDRAVPPPPPVSCEFTADGGGMHAEFAGDRFLRESGFHIRVNLVSLFLGELGVSSHQRSFSFAIEETLPSLPQLAS